MTTGFRFGRGACVAVLTLGVLGGSESALAATRPSDLGSTQSVLYVAGENGAGVLPLDGGAAGSLGQSLASPGGIAVDPVGNIVVADTGNSRVVLLPAGAGAQQVLGDATSGLDHPGAVAVGPGNLVEVANTNGNTVVSIPEAGGSPTAVNMGNDVLSHPQGVAVDGFGGVFISDTTNNRVLFVTASGGAPQVISVAPLSLLRPMGLALDLQGDLFIADSGNNRIVVVPGHGGTPTTVPTGSFTLLDPRGVAVDTSGDVFVADTGNDRILEVAAGSTQPTVISSGSATPWGNPLGLALKPPTPPTLTAVVTSHSHKSKYGWYPSPVTVTFTCTAGSAPLASGCPSPVKLGSSRAHQSVRRVISDTDGTGAALTVSGINIDRVAPVIVIKGVVSGHTYSKSPRFRCVAHDKLSGLVRRCLTVSGAHTSLRHANPTTTISYTATATDRAGNTTTSSGHYRLRH